MNVDNGVSLLMIRGADTSARWTDRWLRGYPETALADIAASNLEEACLSIAQAWASLNSGQVAIVAEGAGVSAFLYWWAMRCSLANKQRVLAVICVPYQEMATNDAVFDCPTAWVVESEAVAIKNTPKGARVLLNSGDWSGSWSWGMQLLAEMLAAAKPRPLHKN